MGKVVQLSDYRETVQQKLVPVAADSKVPIQFALGKQDRRECLQILARYGVSSIEVRRVHEQEDVALLLVSVLEAIWLNKRILEREDLSDDEIAAHIDIIQMLENIDPEIMEKLWASFTTDPRS